MESNSLNCSSIQTVHSIEFKFRTYIIGYRSTYCVDFGEFRINNFFYRSTKKNSYTLQLVESNYKMYASVYAMLSTKFKFDMRIVDYRSSYYLNLCVRRICSFSYKIHKMSCITSYRQGPTYRNGGPGQNH